MLTSKSATAIGITSTKLYGFALGATTCICKYNASALRLHGSWTMVFSLSSFYPMPMRRSFSASLFWIWSTAAYKAVFLCYNRATSSSNEVCFSATTGLYLQGNSNSLPAIVYQTNKLVVPARYFLPSSSSFSSFSAVVISFTRLSMIGNVDLVVWLVHFSASCMPSKHSYFGSPTQDGILFVPSI